MPMPSKIYPGYRSGMLTAEYKTDRIEQKSPVWHCRCDCGGFTETTTKRLLSGAAKNCGCERVSNPRERDLTGQRFGKLTVLSRTEKRMDQGSVVWLCQCDCGKQKEVSARRLIRGRVRSCGCLSDPPPKDYVGKRFGRLTVMEYGGREYRRTEKSRATINLWKCRCDCGKEVLVPQSELQSGESGSCGCLMKERSQEALRLVDGTSVTILEGVKKGLRSTNKSGHTGVCLLKDGSYQAYISFKKKRYYLGKYHDIKDAVRAREAAEKMHDDFLAWYYETHPAGKPAAASGEEKTQS